MNNLSDEQKKVILDRGTEKPFSGSHLTEKRDGVFVCAQCNSELFDSDSKFESGSGWPAFDGTKESAVKLNEDNSLGMKRISVECAKCDGHLGHFFENGMTVKDRPQYCINSVSLDFKATGGNL